MKVSLTHVPHIATRIAVDLSRSGLVTMTKGLETTAKEAETILSTNIKKEMALEEKVKEIVNANEEQIDFYLADAYEDRYSDIAHQILDVLYEEDLINYDVSENRIKNIIFDAITGSIADSSEIESAVYEKIKSYKRNLIPGTDEYEIVYEKLYKDELVRRGMA
ncbi:hypothetical protein B649_11140 [Candidatus Sulfuricurvum sp. RIFRC-1]|uniref:DUF507 family protein n=1 Tax=Candidatus Sulfuricurvum sp. RIFRC-1 TaxID=1249480 RepID=UPI000299965C|nr:DUF507 family protein [Candidatus Sulfuricurvum sp. RIFRC-1]AFV98539.1 hypothetical protein B649_11140 [Candidatus Sulfuricurvum sp. RIFRC-1]